MGSDGHRRRQYLIDRRQGRFIVLVGIYFLAAILVFAAVIFAPLILELRAGSGSIFEQSAIADQFLVLHKRFWPAALLVLGLLAVHAVFVSHRVVGPLYRFRQTFAAMAEGDLSVRVQLREHDYLTDEAELLDETIGAVGRRFDGLQALRDELDAAVDRLDAAVDADDRGAARKQLEEIRDLLQRGDALLDDVRTRTGES